MLAPLALAYVGWLNAQGRMSFGHNGEADLLIGVSGLVTAVPLLLFAGAARRMDYSLLGFFQFLSPSIGVLLGLFVFHEVLTSAQMACFALIWSGVAVFCWDMARASRRAG